jgi:hypothetical protein
MIKDTSISTEQDKLLREILIDKLLRASDCSIISLIIMTANKISKELINEDIIEQISLFVKIHLTETIFPHYDSVYKAATNSNNLLHESSAKSSTNAKRKLMSQFNNSTNSHTSHGGSAASILNNKTKQMQHFFNKMREILCLISQLICQVIIENT